MPIDITQLSDVKNLQRVQPLWLQHRRFWCEVDEIRSRVVDKDKHLVKGWLEPTDEFSVRKKLTKFVPETPVALGQVCGAVCSDQPNRTDLPGGLGDWSRAVDIHERTMGAWMERIATPLTAYYGCLDVVVEPPPLPDGVRPEDVTSRADLEALGIARPRLVHYTPLHTRNWRMDPRTGKLEWVLFYEEGYRLQDGLGPRVPQRIYRLYDTESWHEVRTEPEDDRGFGEMAWEDSGEPKTSVDGMRGEKVVSIQSGPHGAPGQVPVVTFMIDPLEERIGQSFVRSSVELDFKRLLLESDHSYAIHVDAHQQLAVRSHEKPGDIGVGTGKFIHLRPASGENEAEDAFYLEHSSEGFQAREREIRRTHIDSRRQIGADPHGIYDDEQPATAESGVSRAISFRTSEGRHISSIRDAMEHHENNLLRLVAVFLGETPPEGVLVNWPKLQGDEPASDTVETMTSARSAVRSETFKREAEKRIVTATLGDDLETDLQRKIEHEIDTTEAPDPLAALAGFGAGQGGPGGFDDEGVDS